jgi:hypothetical protein
MRFDPAAPRDQVAEEFGASRNCTRPGGASGRTWPQREAITSCRHHG